MEAALHYKGAQLDTDTLLAIRANITMQCASCQKLTPLAHANLFVQQHSMQLCLPIRFDTLAGAMHAFKVGGFLSHSCLWMVQTG